jgi:hypothetical protein
MSLMALMMNQPLSCIVVWESAVSGPRADMNRPALIQTILFRSLLSSCYEHRDSSNAEKKFFYILAGTTNRLSAA